MAAQHGDMEWLRGTDLWAPAQDLAGRAHSAPCSRSSSLRYRVEQEKQNAPAIEGTCRVSQAGEGTSCVALQFCAGFDGAGVRDRGLWCLKGPEARR